MDHARHVTLLFGFNAAEVVIHTTKDTATFLCPYTKILVYMEIFSTVSSVQLSLIVKLVIVVLRHFDERAFQQYVSAKGQIASVVNFLFHGHIKITCAALTFPTCAVERGTVIPMPLVIFIWSAIIYNPVSYWF